MKVPLSRPGAGLFLVLALASAAGCGDLPPRDGDGDGVPAGLDCDDLLTTIGPTRVEVAYNGVDDDCSPDTPDDDLDGDGYPRSTDCDDSRAAIAPDQPEVVYNGVDDDCNPTTLDDDLDSDGYEASSDCDDEDGFRHPGRTEAPYNGVDDDCDPGTPDDDLDGDGYLLSSDCDDGRHAVNPDGTEMPYNGLDDDCDPATLDDDLDGDGVPLALDCDDDEPARSPLLVETPYNGLDDDCDPATLDDDLDRDGYPSADDCDDDEPLAYPGGSETPYNGIDDDCDPFTPDDDVDGDGYPNDTDCDDHWALVNPGALEVAYNGFDDDCDPLTLDDDLDRDGAPIAFDCDDDDPLRAGTFAEIPYNGIDDDCDSDTWDDDVDQDGFPNATDCDDFEPTAHPGGVEIVYTGVDEDCDPLTLDDDLDGDGYPIATDCSDQDASVSPGQVEVCGDGIDNDCDPAFAPCSPAGEILASGSEAKLLGEAANHVAGTSLSVGDINGDGYGDVLVGSTKYNGDGIHYGAVYIFYGGEGVDRIEGDLSLSSADAIIRGLSEITEPRTGIGVGVVGDLDGDGYDDFAVAGRRDGWATTEAIVHVFYGGEGAELLAGTIMLADADATITSLYTSGSLGFAGAPRVGDVNGDGFDDLLLGDRYEYGSAYRSGVVHLFYGGDGADLLAGDLSPADSDLKLVGEAEEDQAGWDYEGAGDVDGDGYADIIIGAPFHDSTFSPSGSVYLIYGRGGAETLLGSLSLSQSDLIIEGSGVNALLGYSLAGPGDVDGDGFDDLWIGESGHREAGFAIGRGLLFYGRSSADRLAGILSANAADAIFLGIAATDGYHARYVGGGDLNGDGLADILMNTYYPTVGGLANRGVVDFFYGRSPRMSGTRRVDVADLRILGDAAGDRMGVRTCLRGDMDGDGYSDLLLGSYYDDEAAEDAGAAHLIYGGGH